MTKEQKQEYVDCVIYLINYATAMENDANIAKFCYDIVKKAQFLYNLRVHLFNPEMKEELEEQIEKYNNLKYRWDYENSINAK